MERYNYKQLKRLGIVSAEEYPFPVPLTATELGNNPRLAETMRSRYPNLVFGSAVMVDGNIIIDDVETGDDARLLNTCSTRSIQVFKSSAVNALLNQMIPLPNDVIKLCVQGGGEDVRRLNQDTNTDNVIKVRKVPTGKGLIIEDIILPSFDEKIKEIIIYDDVVASGWTAKKVAYKIRENYPNIKLNFATWFMLAPDNDECAGISGYDKVYTTYIAQGNLMKRPPINSLSCLLRNDAKSEVVRREYIRKYIASETDFYKIIAQLKGGEKT